MGPLLITFIKYKCMLPPVQRKAQIPRRSHRSHGCRPPWRCSWACCQTPPSGRTSTWCTRRCPGFWRHLIWIHTLNQIKSGNLVEVSSIEKDRLWILFPYFLLPLVNARNSTEAIGAILNFSIFHSYFASAGFWALFCNLVLTSALQRLVVTLISWKCAWKSLMWITWVFNEGIV